MIVTRLSGAGLPLAIAQALLLLAEMYLLSQQFDAYTLLKDGGLKSWQQPFAYLGTLPKLGFVACFIFVIISRDSLRHWSSQLEAGISALRLAGFLPFQLLAFLLLWLLTQVIFASPESAGEVPAWIYACWVLAALATLSLWLFALFPAKSIWSFLVVERQKLGLTLAISVLILLAASFSQGAWGWLAVATFAVSSWLLSGYDPDLVISVPEERLLGLGDFVVNIAPACSGYEGIGLITGFTAVYLFVYRKEFRFPKALLLFPIGAVSIWLLNSARISLLIIIGHYGHREVAIGGFHSHAGWLAFILTSAAVLLIADRYRTQVVLKPTSDDRAADIAVGSLIPFVALMAMTLVSSLFSTGFDYLYPLRVLVVGGSILVVWKWLSISWVRPGLLPTGMALLVALVWILMLDPDEAVNRSFVDGLSSMSLGWASLWMVARVLGAVVTVPIAEELAFRGYLLSKMSCSEVRLVGHLPMKIIPIIVSSVAFGLLHGAWLAGGVAGVAFALVRLRSASILPVIYCHALTNAVIFIYAAFANNWVLI